MHHNLSFIPVTRVGLPVVDGEVSGVPGVDGVGDVAGVDDKISGVALVGGFPVII